MHDLNTIDYLAFIPIILFSLSIHEFAHGYVADRLGDNTPRWFGRLSLNPLTHIDPIGMLVLLLTRRFGWAKPVPINPRNFSDPVRGSVLVSIAGPLSNLSLAIIIALPFRFGFIKNYTNITAILINSIYLNIGLAIFNLIPLPPLDGSKILAGILSPKYYSSFSKLEKYGSILLVLLMFSGGISTILSPIVQLVFKYIIGLH